MGQFKLLSATVALTVLIWTVAEQMTTGEAEFTARIAVQSPPNSALVLTQAADGPEFYWITVNGRQTVVEELRDAPPAALTITVSDRAIGPVDLQLVDELRAAALPQLRGCTVESVRPPSMRVQIDRRITISVPVLVKPGNLAYDVEPIVEPDTVNATILETEYQRIAEAFPRVELDAETHLRDKTEGEPITLRNSVPLSPVVQSDAGPVNASLEPDMVTLRATLRHQQVTGTIQAVPIQFRGSWSVLSRVEIEYRDPNPAETISIKIVGPPDLVDRLISGERKTFAVIPLGAADNRGGGQFQFFRPEFDLPPGVTLAPDFAPPVIELRLVPRASRSHDPERGN